jgi:hypothetical protein
MEFRRIPSGGSKIDAGLVYFPSWEMMGWLDSLLSNGESSSSRLVVGNK